MFTAASITLVLSVLDKVAIGFGGLAISAMTAGTIKGRLSHKTKPIK